MENSNTATSNSIWKIELLVISLIVMVGILVLFPMWKSMDPGYPFWWFHISSICITMYTARMIFLLKHSFLAKMQWLKGLFLLGALPFIFNWIGLINGFQGYCDEVGLETKLNTLSIDEIIPMANYIKAQSFLFGTGSVIGVMVLSFRLIVSIWRVFNNRGI